jgi:hypothetical protein
MRDPSAGTMVWAGAAMATVQRRRIAARRVFMGVGSFA